MKPQKLLSALHDMGVQVVRPGVGRIKLVADSGDVPQQAVDIARPHKAELLRYLCSQRCECGELMTPFGLAVQGWRNFDCPKCGSVKPVREVAN
jgi:hypothetical protein